MCAAFDFLVRGLIVFQREGATMIDRYTKAVLTVIAAALSAIAVQMSVGTASAQLGGTTCGSSSFDACHVEVENTVDVNVESLP
jgi:hypothetical protein